MNQYAYKMSLDRFPYCNNLDLYVYCMIIRIIPRLVALNSDNGSNNYP